MIPILETSIETSSCSDNSLCNFMKFQFLFLRCKLQFPTCTSWVGHKKNYGRCVMFGSANSFASITALARSIEGACGMSVCPRTFPRSKHLNLSYERAFGAHAANREIDVATQHNICAANQDTAEHSKTSVHPIRSEKNKQWRRDRPRSDALVLRAAPASIVEYRLKNCLA